MENNDSVVLNKLLRSMQGLKTNWSNNDVAKEFLARLHSCDEKPGADGMCDCIRFFAAKYLGLKAQKKYLQDFLYKIQDSCPEEIKQQILEARIIKSEINPYITPFIEVKNG